MNKFEHELIVCIVNAGFAEQVMDAARSVGAGGGTVIHAKGTANKEAEALFRITVQPEKEMVMILVPQKLKEDVLHALYKSVGLNTPGQGIAFSLPVDEVVGLSENAPALPKKAKTEKAAAKDAPTPSEPSAEDK
ncbi:MAG TPA: transcriptional regulator [Clostridiales bacterium]|nr:transcriptional regulator [Clostridiales bacterium]